MRQTIPIMIDDNHQLHHLNIYHNRYITSTIPINIVEIAIYQVNTLLAICTDGLLWEGSLAVSSITELKLIDITEKLIDICVMSIDKILILDDNHNLSELDYHTHNIELLYTKVKRIIPNFEYPVRYSSITCTIVDMNDRIHFYNSTGKIISTSITDAEIVRESIIIADGILYTIIIDEVIKLMEGLNNIVDIVIINRVDVTILIINTDDELWLISSTEKKNITGIIPLRFVNMMRTSIIVEDVDYNLHILDGGEVIRYERVNYKLLNCNRLSIRSAAEIE